MVAAEAAFRNALEIAVVTHFFPFGDADEDIEETLESVYERYESDRRGQEGWQLELTQDECSEWGMPTGNEWKWSGSIDEDDAADIAKLYGPLDTGGLGGLGGHPSCAWQSPEQIFAQSVLYTNGIPVIAAHNPFPPVHSTDASKLQRALSSIHSELDACLAASDSDAPPSMLDEIEQCMQQIAREIACGFEAHALTKEEDSLAQERRRNIANNNQRLSQGEARSLSHAGERQWAPREVR